MRPSMPLFLGIILAPTLLLLWTLVYRGSCWALSIPLFMVLVLTHAAREQARIRRRCLADCYFRKGVWLHRLLTAVNLMTVWFFLVSLLLTAVLLGSASIWESRLLLLLCLDALLIAALYSGFFQLARGVLGVRPDYCRLFARQWTLWVNLPLVLSGALWLQLQQPLPVWLDERLDLLSTLQNASASVGASCTLIDLLVRANLEKEALSWWLIMKGTPGIGNEALRWAAWLLFLLAGMLNAWTYTRLCVHLVSIGERFGIKVVRG